MTKTDTISPTIDLSIGIEGTSIRAACSYLNKSFVGKDAGPIYNNWDRTVNTRIVAEYPIEIMPPTIRLAI